MKRNYLILGILIAISSHGESSALEVKTPISTFRSVDLDKRCNALMDYIQKFGQQFLQNKITVTGCAESNGVSGPLYSSDFNVTDDPKNTFRIDVTINNAGKAKVRICDTTFNPTFCTDLNAGTALVFQSNQKSVRSRDSRIYLRNLNENADKILATTYRWVVKKPWNQNIFGMTYDKFVLYQVKNLKGLPFNTEKEKLVIELALKPDEKNSLGSVEFKKLPNKEFLDCFGCDDLKCANAIKYEFKNKFLTFKTDNKEKYGAGWTIDSLNSVESKNKGWKYMCGASGYSLQSFVTPN